MPFFLLCMATCSGMAGAQEPLSNFEACVAEARDRHTDSAMENYLSFKCDGPSAQRLAARPDQCAADVRPSLRNVERRERQLDDGLYLRIIWRTSVCAGMCETRLYNDSRDTNYLCEVRRHLEERALRNYGPPPRNAGYDPRYADDDPPSRPTYSGPAPRRYEPPPRYYVSRPRVTERWYYVEPGRYREYRYDPNGYADDEHRDDYKDRRDDRADDDRSDGYVRYEYR
jgi:hypothetical protein